MSLATKIELERLGERQILQHHVGLKPETHRGRLQLERKRRRRCHRHLNRFLEFPGAAAIDGQGRPVRVELAELLLGAGLEARERAHGVLDGTLHLHAGSGQLALVQLVEALVLSEDVPGVDACGHCDADREPPIGRALGYCSTRRDLPCTRARLPVLLGLHLLSRHACASIESNVCEALANVPRASLMDS